MLQLPLIKGCNRFLWYVPHRDNLRTVRLRAWLVGFATCDECRSKKRKRWVGKQVQAAA